MNKKQCLFGKLYENKDKLKKRAIKVSKYEKALHWFVLLSFLGLCATALAAEHFFSKEAIMDSFKASLPMVNISIPPADQFFISRIARRDTWDIHFYFGVAFGIFITTWLLIGIFRKNSRNVLLKAILFSSAITLTITGVLMFLRLYNPISEEFFGLLKKIHYFAYWAFIYALIVHIIYIIYKENRNSNGALSNMIRFKTIASIALTLTLVTSSISYADENQSNGNDLKHWINDQNYIDGVMYLEGEKGADILTKEISNCPYDKCHLADVDLQAFGTTKIEIVKPDFKKAIKLLTISSENGNTLAADRLLQFLVKRVDYKSKSPNGYLIKQLEEETSLTFNDFINLVHKIATNGSKTNKACFSEYLLGEMYEYGILNNKKDLLIAKKHYNNASKICSNASLYKLLSQGRVNALNK